MRILIIDDDELLCRALARALSREQVVVESCPHRALERVAREVFDLVLCDLHMPVMSGHELLDRLPPRDGMLCLLMSGDGGHGMIPKPFRTSDLWAAVDALRAARSA